MTILRIGETELEVEVIGAGARNAILPPAPAKWELTPRQKVDLEAFREDGWDFRDQPDLDWKAVRPRDSREVLEAGLLAKHPSGALVIIKNRMVVDLGGKFEGALKTRYTGVRKLAYAATLYEVDMGLPAGNLEARITHELSAANVLPDDVLREPVLAYNVRPPRNLAPTAEVPQWQWDSIELRSAWEHAARRGEGVRVAIIDCGFHRNDPQIAGNVEWWARMRKKGDWLFRQTMPRDAHGTFCAGLIGAVDDGTSVHGAAPDCKLILIAMKPSGVVDQLELAEAITICMRGLQTGAPADVISCSLGLTESWEQSKALKAAIDCAVAQGRSGKGIPIVWADFNESKPILPNSLESYPPLLVVAQSDSDDRCVSSGFGPGLDLMAPGVAVVGLDWTGGNATVGRDSGCSYAAPIVAGVAALVLSVNDQLTAQEVADIIISTCDDPPADAVSEHGVGRVNARKAVLAVLATLETGAVAPPSDDDTAAA